MATEIERKFLVDKIRWEQAEKPEGIRIVQGYLSVQPNATVRVRIKGPRAFLTLKGESKGIRRAEFEYSIPIADAEEMIATMTTGTVEKIRYPIMVGEHLWEVDVFSGANEGLIVAEIELKSEAEKFELPEWVGQEVSDDVRYFNAHLSVSPYSSWKKD